MVFIIKKLQDACAKPDVAVPMSNTIKTMSNDSTVRFVESGGKWAWKRYDTQGSVIFRSELFDSERAAHEDYENNGGVSTPSASQEGEVKAPEQTEPVNTTAPVAPVEPAEQAPETQPETGTAEQTTAPAEGDISAENASPEGEAGLV